MLGIYSAYGDLACSGWKYKGAAFPNPIHAKGTGPILVLGNTGDPASLPVLETALATETDRGAQGEMRGAINKLKPQPAKATP